MTAHWSDRYLGRPWQNGADGPGAYDCYGLVRAAYRDIRGVDMPIVDTDGLSTKACVRAFDAYADYGPWQVVTDMQDMDVVVMGHGKKPHHVGLWIAHGTGFVLHALESTGVCRQSASSLLAHGWNILDVYRRRDA